MGRKGILPLLLQPLLLLKLLGDARGGNSAGVGGSGAGGRGGEEDDGFAGSEGDELRISALSVRLPAMAQYGLQVSSSHNNKNDSELPPAACCSA